MTDAERLERIRDNVKAAEFDDGTYWAPHYAKDCGLLLAEVERLRAASAKLALECATQHEEVERLRGVVERAEGVVASVSELGDSYREMPGSKFVSAKSVQRLVAALAKLEAKHG